MKIKVMRYKVQLLERTIINGGLQGGTERFLCWISDVGFDETQTTPIKVKAKEDVTEVLKKVATRIAEDNLKNEKMVCRIRKVSEVFIYSEKIITE